MSPSITNKPKQLARIRRLLKYFEQGTIPRLAQHEVHPDLDAASSEYLGIVPVGASSLQVEAAWKELLVGGGINPTQVHPVLWNWSRNRFMPEV